MYYSRHIANTQQSVWGILHQWTRLCLWCISLGTRLSWLPTRCILVIFLKKSNLSVIYNFIWQQICHYSDLVIYSKSVRLWLDTQIISCACNYHLEDWLSQSHLIYFTGQSHSVSVHSPCYSLSSNHFKGEQISSWLHTVAVVLVELWSSIPVFSSVTLE